MMNRKNMFQLFKYNFKTLVSFELIYKTIVLLMFIFISVSGFNLTLQHTNDYYLSMENLNSVIYSNEAFIYYFVLIIFFILTEVYHTTALILLFDSSYQREKMKLKNLFLITNVKCLQLLNIKNLISGIIFFSTLIYFKFNHSDMLLNFINICIKHRLLFAVVIFIFIVFLLKRKYIFHFILLENMRFKISKKKSIKLTKYHFFEDLSSLFFTFLFSIILFYLMYTFTYQYLSSPKTLENLSTTMIWCIILLVITIFLSLTKILYYLNISILFYKQKIEKGDIVDINTYEDIIGHKFYKLFCFGIMIIILFITIKTANFAYEISEGKINFQTEHINKIGITAHRGASHNYPENTMRAFKGAKKLGADWIELDVQKTKDGKIIILHDPTFKTIVGIDKSPSELPYHMIKRYDAGSFFGKEFAGEKIPLLEDVIIFAKKNNIKLNIELKPYIEGDHLEEDVVRLVQKHHFQKRCAISSQMYTSLETVKKMSSEIKTCYISYEADEKIISLDYIDGFCAENSIVDEKLVEKIHDLNKEIWVWTVDEKELLNHMIDLKVDNIITDDVVLTKKILKEKKVNNRKKESIFVQKIFQ